VGETLTVVTGASSGIGRAVAEAALAAGHEVATCSRRPGPGRHLPADLADPAQWPVVADWLAALVVERAWDRVVLVHSAATLEPIGFAGEVDPAAYAANVVLNSAAPQVLGDAFVRAMGATSARGILVLISSGAGRQAYPGWTSYCASKAATDHWARAAGMEQDQRGGRIRVLSVAPGVVETDMQARIRASDERDFPNVERFIGMHDQGQLADPDEVGRLLLALADRDDLANGAVLDLREL
jgi:benzil reductase ((S)-benzoin forming)